MMKHVDSDRVLHYDLRLVKSFLIYHEFVPTQVNVLMHTADVKLSPHQLSKIKKLKEEHAKEDKSELFHTVNMDNREHLPAELGSSSGNGFKDTVDINVEAGEGDC